MSLFKEVEENQKALSSCPKHEFVKNGVHGLYGCKKCGAFVSKEYVDGYNAGIKRGMDRKQKKIEIKNKLVDLLIESGFIEPERR